MSSPFGLPGWPRLIPLPQPSSLPHSSRSQPSCFTIFFVSRAALSGACLLLNVFVRARQCCAISGQLDPLLNVRRQPIQECLVPELRVLRLQHPVAFVGKNHQLRRHSLPLQRVEKLERLRVRHAVIHFAGDHQRRRLTFRARPRTSPAPISCSFPDSTTACPACRVLQTRVLPSRTLLLCRRRSRG